MGKSPEIEADIGKTKVFARVRMTVEIAVAGHWDGGTVSMKQMAKIARDEAERNLYAIASHHPQMRVMGLDHIEIVTRVGGQE